MNRRSRSQHADYWQLRPHPVHQLGCHYRRPAPGACGGSSSLAMARMVGYGAYYWTANAVGTTLQFARFYVPALAAISLLGAWLVTRIPGRAWLAGLTTTAVIAAMFGLGTWSYHDMAAHPFPACASSPAGCTTAAPALPSRPIRTADQDHVFKRSRDSFLRSVG